MIGEALLEYSLNGTIATTVGNKSSIASPHGVYPCRGEDRWISIVVGNEREWDALCGAANVESWATDGRFADLSGRLRERQELDGLIAAWTAAAGRVGVGRPVAASRGCRQPQSR